MLARWWGWAKPVGYDMCVLIYLFVFILNMCVLFSYELHDIYFICVQEWLAWDHKWPSLPGLGPKLTLGNILEPGSRPKVINEIHVCAHTESMMVMYSFMFISRVSMCRYAFFVHSIIVFVL